MPDFQDFFGEFTDRKGGGPARILDVLDSQTLPWTVSPPLMFGAQVRYQDVLTGPAVVGQQVNWAFTAGQNTSGTLRAVFSGDFGADVTVDTTVGAADNATAISAAVETAVDGEAALSGVVDSTTDNGGDIDTVFVDDIGVVTVTWTWIPDNQTWDVQFGGTLVDGNYDTVYSFDGMDDIIVRTVRSGGTPATVLAMAQQHEADTEGDVRLTGLLMSADDDATDTNLIILEAGAPDCTITCVAPGTATLVPTETTGAVSVANSETRFIDLNTLSPQGAFPNKANRGDCSVEVLTTWGASRTLTVGDAGSTDGIFGSTPLDLNTAGRTSGDSSAAERLHRIEDAAYVPIAAFVIGDPSTLTQGSVYIEIGMTPVPR